MINFPSPEPKKCSQNNQRTPQVKISPVKVPTGAKQIGNYILGKTIGSGSFGKVHLGLHIPTGEKVAVKIIDKLKLNSRDLERVDREIQIMKKMLHPSVIQLYEIIQTQKSLLLIMEYMQNGELFNYIILHKKLSQKNACQIFQQLIDAIEYIHSMGVAHRDLKPENILMDYDGRIKIIDFGLSNQYKEGEKLKTECGSPCYAAPEMIEGKHRYDPLKIDIWSSGIVLFAMLCGYLPFCDNNTEMLYKKILAGSYKFPQWISSEVKDLITLLLITNPKERASIEQIRNHKWYKSANMRRNHGIDPRFYRVPFENYIIKSTFANPQKRNQASHKIEINEKSKETATYYLIVKKLAKEGHKLPTFFGSQYFDICNLSPFTEEGDSGTTVIDSNSAPIAPKIMEQEDPVTGGLPNFTYKSVQFQEILKQFMIIEPTQVNEEEEKKKQIFYAYNLENQKKRQQLKAKTTKQKAITLLYLKKPSKVSTNLKTLSDKKSVLDILQNLNDKPATSIHKVSRRVRTQSSCTEESMYRYNTKKEEKETGGKLPRLPSLFKNGH